MPQIISPPPSAAPHRRQLRRVGFLLLFAAAVDLAMLAYCVTHRINFASSVGVASLLASIFLFLGSLRTASAARWAAALLLPMMLVAVSALPFLMPFDLLCTGAKLHSPATILGVIYLGGVIALCVALLRMLGNESIDVARNAAGRPRRNLFIPVALGCVLGSTLVVAVYYITHGRAARHAEELAAAQLGPDYRYFTSFLKMSWRNSEPRRSYYAQVTVWNDCEIKTAPVWWDE